MSMYNQIQRASMPQGSNDPRMDQAIEKGFRWMEQATFNAASRMLPKMGEEKQATVWNAVKGDPYALQSYITHLGKRQGIIDPVGLDRLAQDYISTQSAKFGG